MEMKQIATIVNQMSDEFLGGSVIVNENLDNIVDFGDAIKNIREMGAYIESLVNHIGKVIVVNRSWSGDTLGIMRESWEWGSILEKITIELPEAVENDSWELTDGQSYDPNVFYSAKASAKFFNKRTTFEIPMSFTRMQLVQSFSNAGQYQSFVSGIETAIEKKMSIAYQNLAMRLINSMAVATIQADKADTDTAITTAKAVNLLKLYNDTYGATLTADTCMKDPKFLRECSRIIKTTSSYMSRPSTLFNIDKADKFTPKSLQHLVLLTDFVTMSEYNMQADTFHDDLVKLPYYREVPFWQGSGDKFEWDDTSKVHATVNGVETTINHLVGVLFDHDAIAITNFDRRTTSNYNPKAEFTSTWHKSDCGYMADSSENFVAFFIA